MATNNSWNNQINGSYNQIILNAGTNGVAISTDASAATVNIATGAAVKTVTLGSTNSTSPTTINSGTGTLALTTNGGNIISTSNNGIISLDSGTGVLGISTGAAATTVNIANGAAVKTLTLGSTNSTSTTTVQSGTGALNITSTNGVITINSGTAALNISSDSVATTVNVGTGSGVKGVTLGSLNTTSATIVQSGTAGIILKSATGDIIVATGAGEVTKPLQPAFLAYLASTVTNVTGTGTAFQMGTTTALTEVFDQNSDFNTNGTFTAPVTGKYHFSGGARVNGVTIAVSLTVLIVTSNRNYSFDTNRPASNSTLFNAFTALADMDAADTAVVTVATTGEAADTDDLFGQGLPNTFFSGYLAC